MVRLWPDWSDCGQILTQFDWILPNLAEFHRIWLNLAEFHRIWLNLAVFGCTGEPGPIPRVPPLVRTVYHTTTTPGTTTLHHHHMLTVVLPYHRAHRPGSVHQASFGYSPRVKIPTWSKPPLFVGSKPTCQNCHFCEKSLPKPHSFDENGHFSGF